jgi:RimJ/RimL family protein N-acetyltransferase
MNVRRATVKDNETIKGIYADKSIWPFVTDDGALDIQTINFTDALNNQGVYFIIVEDNNKPVGVFLFNPWNTVTYEMHSAVLPEYRGAGSREAAYLAGMWMFKNTPCQKIVTQIPQINVLARALAKKCGMTLEGNNKKSFLKNGKLIDQYIFGICKEDV